MSKYMISITAGEACNPEYGPDKEMENMGVDGFFIVGFRNRKPIFEIMMGAAILDMSKWIFNRGPGAQKIRAACAIANGEITAEEILNNEEGKGTLAGPTFGTLTGKAMISEDMIRKILGRGNDE